MGNLITLGLDSWRPERRAITLADIPALAEIISSNASAGVSVTEGTATKNSAFWCAVDLISNDVAKLPRKHYRAKEDQAGVDSKERIRRSPIERLIRKPNANVNGFDFWKALIYHVLTWGNGYAEIERNQAGKPIALHNVLPYDIQPEITRGERGDATVRYLYGNTKRAIAADDMIHVKGLSRDGIVGYSIVYMARLSIGLGLAAEQFGAGFFGNGARPGVALMIPKSLGADGRNQARDEWNRAVGGPQRAGGTVILEGGWDLKTFAIPPDDAQFLETREFQVVEIARWFNLPPHKLKHKMGERPGGNLRDSELDYLSTSLDPWIIRLEEELVQKLLRNPDESGEFIEHERAALMRMFAEERADTYKKYLDMGVISREYIAARENLPAPPSEDDPPEPNPDQREEPSKDLLDAQRALLVDIGSRFVRRESEGLRRGPKSDRTAYMGWLLEHYAEEERVLISMLAPAVRVALATADCALSTDFETIATSLAREYVERSLALVSVLPVAGFRGALEKMVVTWESFRPLEIADQVMKKTQAQPKGG